MASTIVAEKMSDSQSESSSPLLNESEVEEVSSAKFKAPTSSRGWKKLLMLTFTLAPVTIITAVYILTLRTLGRTHAIIDCGSTNEEAISRGCFMEPMVYGWMPPSCYFPDLSSQYQPFTDRDWYSDPDVANDSKISPEDIWAGKHLNLYVHRYHTDHCLFLWRKLSWAVQTRSDWLDTKTLSVSHTDHCAKELSRAWEKENGTNNVTLGFYHCVRLPWN